MADQIRAEVQVKAPIAKVWAAYSSPEAIKVWNTASPDWHTTAASVDLREGGKFSSRMEAKDGSLGFDFAGTYTCIVPHERIEYVFGERTAVVTFSEAPGGVLVRVSFDAEATHSREQQQQGWQAILHHFAQYTESAEAP